eukprot:2768263-Pleurochrysis_carterae.AAC.4
MSTRVCAKAEALAQMQMKMEVKGARQSGKRLMCYGAPTSVRERSRLDLALEPTGAPSSARRGACLWGKARRKHRCAVHQRCVRELAAF